MVLHQTYPKCLVHKHKPDPNPKTKIQSFSSMAKEQQKLERGSLQPSWVRKRKRRDNQRGLKERREEKSLRKERRKERGDGQPPWVREREERVIEV